MPGPITGGVAGTVYDWVESIVVSPWGVNAEASARAFEYQLQFGMTLTGVWASCDTANPPTGSAAQFDVKKNGTTMLSTPITIDAGESSSRTAATPPVISVSTLVAGDTLLFVTDQVGSTNPGQGYKIYLKGPRTS